MLLKVKETIASHSMVTPGERLIVAVSGGPDSVALLKVMTIIARDLRLFLIAAHFNHGIRGAEADREQNFVQTLCHDLQVACVSEKMIIADLKKPGMSWEELCREQRYVFLNKVAAVWGATKIALGHHLQDQAETVLMNLLRGSGADGLRGMLPVRGGMIIRPLLRTTRREILAFIDDQRLSFMSDSSNANNLYQRNRIRHHLIPLLKDAYNGRIEENLARTAEIMRLDNDFLSAAVAEWFNKWVTCSPDGNKRLPQQEFLCLHPALQRRVLKKLLEQASPSRQGIGYQHIQAALTLAQGFQGSATLDLPKGVLVKREYQTLVVSTPGDTLSSAGRRQIAENPGFCYAVQIPGRIDVPEAGRSLLFQFVAKPSLDDLRAAAANCAYLDYESLDLPLVVRSFIHGDRMQPLGMADSKKLKALFIDAKVPHGERQRLPLLADRHSVVWAAGLRMSARAAVRERTRKVLKVEII